MSTSSKAKVWWIILSYAPNSDRRSEEDTFLWRCEAVSEKMALLRFYQEMYKDPRAFEFGTRYNFSEWTVDNRLRYRLKTYLSRIEEKIFGCSGPHSKITDDNIKKFLFDYDQDRVIKLLSMFGDRVIRSDTSGSVIEV